MVSAVRQRTVRQQKWYRISGSENDIGYQKAKTASAFRQRTGPCEHRPLPHLLLNLLFTAEHRKNEISAVQNGHLYYAICNAIHIYTAEIIKREISAVQNGHLHNIVYNTACFYTAERRKNVFSAVQMCCSILNIAIPVRRNLELF